MRGATRSESRRSPAGGFTLIELLVVLAIIGILVTFILIAAQDGIRRAQERATQSLIAKLESGVSDRIEAILLQRASISLGHYAMASVTNANFTAVAAGDPNYALISTLSGLGFIGSTQAVLSPQRAQVIAQFDLVRAQMPDVFFVQGTASSYAKGSYPINFAGVDFPVGSGSYLVPLGSYYLSGSPNVPAAGAAPGDPNQAIGIYGASFAIAGGIYKNLGYGPQGYDGADNNSDGYVDDWAEGILTGNAAQITANLQAHTHVTARAEMLYAMLIEGGGPMGSVFNRDDFTNREVQDTDGDGLPEFVDAWGHPLQFFRWPIYYNNLSATTVPTAAYGSTGYPAPVGYVQKGADIYNGPWETPQQPMEPRQTDPLDPNQTLMAPAWFSSTVNTGGGPTSFMNYFHSLLEPTATANATVGAGWDRSGAYQRRAFYSRPLILSGGPDETPGVFLYADSALAGGGNTAALALVHVENQAAAWDISDRSGTNLSQVASSPGAASILLLTAGGDDITNQGMASPTGGVR